jgi:ribosomal protein S18 acetylase RimI-like enzyme
LCVCVCVCVVCVCVCLYVSVHVCMRVLLCGLRERFQFLVLWSTARCTVQPDVLLELPRKVAGSLHCCGVTQRRADGIQCVRRRMCACVCLHALRAAGTCTAAVTCPRPRALCCVRAAVIGKAEGSGVLWHGHVSCVTVAPEYRRLGLAKVLMDDLERNSEKA